jgi:hypothetical protein
MATDVAANEPQVTATSQLPGQQAKEQPQAEPEVPEAWKAEFKKVINQRDQLKAKFGETEQKLQEFQAKEAAHAAELAARREAEENKKLAEKGQYEELLAKKDRQRTEEVGRIKEAVVKNVTGLWIRAAASEIPNLTPEARRDLPLLLKENIRVDEFGQAQVVNEAGLPRLDDNGKQVDPIEFIKSFVSARSYMLLDGMPKSHGGSSTTGEPTKAAKDIETMMATKDNKAMADWQEKDPAGFTQALNAYTVSLAKKAKGMKR